MSNIILNCPICGRPNTFIDNGDRDCICSMCNNRWKYVTNSEEKLHKRITELEENRDDLSKACRIFTATSQKQVGSLKFAAERIAELEKQLELYKQSAETDAKLLRQARYLPPGKRQ